MMLETSKRFNKRVLIKLLCLSLAIAVVLPFSFSVFAAPKLSEKFGLDEKPDNQNEDIYKDFIDYSDVLKTYEENNYSAPNVDPIILEPSTAVRSEGEPKLSSGYNGRTGDAIVWDDRAPQYEWTFNVPASGLYQIFVEYTPIEGDTLEIQRSLTVNGKTGETLFRQIDNIFFNRKWEESEKPQEDLNGDERSPRLKQIFEWNEMPILDAKAMYSAPLQFYFEQGENKIALKYISGTMTVGNIRIAPAEELPTYDEYIKSYSKKYEGEPLIFEAEEAAFRSHQVLRRSYDADPSTSPKPTGKVKQNVIGSGWNTGNKDITWVVDVPEDGLYRLAFRVRQNGNQGITSHRQILIDGKVPFKEAEAYPFEYLNRWRTQEVEINEEEPYLFWLEKGQREITLRIKVGELTPFLNAIERTNLKLSKTIRKITKVTSTQPDPNFDYELFEKIPDLKADFEDFAKVYREQAETLLEMSSKRPTQVNTLLSMAEEIEDLIKHPDRIPRKLNDLNTMQSNLSDMFTAMQSQGMAVDFVELVAADEEAKDFESSFWQKVVVSFRNFIQSFFKDYDSPAIGDQLSDDKMDEYEVIDVWVAREKQWAELIQQLTTEEFTPEKNIYVNMNILPSGTAAANVTSPLMLSIISGKAPDVALGSDAGTPVELAIREASYDLSQFPDFNEIKERFLPGHLTPFEYEGGTYALPETMDFQVMYYRTDIMEELGLEVPDTWDELFSKTLPIIRQSGGQMLMPADFQMFLFQNGGELYKDNNRKTAIDSEEAYDAFVKWTNAYTVYRMAAIANLLQHFRLGSIPIFVSPASTYIQITHAAPELYGKWDIALIPGTPQADGTISRYAGGGVGSVLMFSGTDNPEAGWEYLKWWTSADVQTRFGAEIESTIGPEARWLSANVEAFEAMSWDADHLEVMREAMGWVKNAPNVLGGYYTGRSINNAWTRVVMANMDPRDSLEQAVKEINRELERKNDEYDKIYGRDKKNKN